MADQRALQRIYRRIVEINKKVKACDQQTELSAVQTLLRSLNDEWKEMKELDRVYQPAVTDQYEEQILKIEKQYYEAKDFLFKIEIEVRENVENSKMNCTIDDLVINQQSFLKEFHSANKNDEIRLPPLNLPTFSGNYAEFPSFRGLFEASVHNNPKYSKVYKLKYLKNFLREPAASLIRHMDLTDANYEEAWDKLIERYDKPDLVIISLIKQFLDQPSITKASAKSLHSMADVSDEVLRGFKVLGEDAQKRDPWLVYSLVQKLDRETKEAWSLEVANECYPSLDSFFSFLRKRGNALEKIDMNQSSTSARHNASRNVKALHSNVTANVCAKCNDQHYLNNCEEFLKLNIPDRKAFVAERKLCFVCLAANHQAVVCRSRYRCGKCKKRHHLTLHIENDDLNRAEISNPEPDTCTKTYNTSIAFQKQEIDPTKYKAILPTAVVLIADVTGRMQKCRALLDSGSEASFITESCVQKLGLQRRTANVTVSGLTNGILKTKGVTTVTAHSLHQYSNKISIDTLVLVTLPCRVPSVSITLKEYKVLDELKLADPEYSRPGSIDILIGADRFFYLLLDGQRTIENSSIIARNSIFGWIVSGTSAKPADGSYNVESNFSVVNFQVDVNLDSTLRKFWEIEEVLPTENKFTQEEKDCEQHFIETCKKCSDGRFIIEIPFKKEAKKLGNSFYMAKKRYYGLEQRFDSCAAFKNEYTKCIDEYISNGYLKLLTKTETLLDVSQHFYLPHHAVTKASSLTTKTRIVFDGSAKSANGVSLNERMMVGPTIQPSLWSTLMRFRRHKISLTADITRMYNQIRVADGDTNFQRILWRDHVDKEIQQYKLTTVTFGLSSSAFIAIRCLQQIAIENRSANPDVADIIMNDFYVDDLISGADTKEDAKDLKENLSNLLSSAGFHLTKWMSSSPEVLVSTEQQSMRFEPSDTKIPEAKILGLQWNSLDDTFSFNVNINPEMKITKRTILSESSRIFDPLSWLSPVTIQFKMLFQRLWLVKLDWDDDLPTELCQAYQHLRREIHRIEDVKIQRHVELKLENLEIHGFCDASEKAYGAVIYAKTISEEGEVKINLLTSKSKVSPIRQVTLPRLELCGAHLLAKLMQAVQQILPKHAKYFAWTDSTIVLAWLSDYPAKWKTFVANRTSDILERFPRSHWQHVKSEDNPADHISRGMPASKLATLSLWWSGPIWLSNLNNCYSSTTEKLLLSTTEECKKQRTEVYTATTNYNNISILFEKYSSFQKIVRILMYVIRYYNHLKKKLRHTENVLSEREQAVFICIKWAQHEEFFKEIKDLTVSKRVANNSKLVSLSPFLDANSILRVGGRLQQADIEYDAKHPIILPKLHILTKYIIQDTHIKNLHSGPTLTSHLIRQNFWIIGGQATIRTQLKDCVTCKRFRGKTSQQLMGCLPKSRVTPSRPFTQCGIDYAGPILLATKRGRGAKLVKGYISIFVCMSTKAVHLEPVSDLTTAAFIAALRRFAARRGVPAEIYTDNGSNFIGADRELKRVIGELNSNKNCSILEYSAQYGTQWHFIPPMSPNFGGLWEAAVKSVKTHLLKFTGNAHLTFEEMSTLLTQIEVLLNSRPLYSIVTDDHTIDVLTPSHFLFGSATGLIPERNYSETPTNRLTRWELVQQKVQQFWKRYQSEYLNTLHQRNKWQNTTENLKPGDVVTVKEDNLPPGKWALAKIVEVHPDTEGLIRVVTVKTATSTFKRPITKICKLPIC